MGNNEASLNAQTFHVQSHSQVVITAFGLKLLSPQDISDLSHKMIIVIPCVLLMDKYTKSSIHVQQGLV